MKHFKNLFKDSDTIIVSFVFASLIGLFIYGFSRPIEYTTIEPAAETIEAPAEMHLLNNLVVLGSFEIQ